MSDEISRNVSQLPSDTEGPEGGHLALMVRDGDGHAFIPIPRGASLYIVEANKAVVPLILSRVTHQNIEFVCACGEKGCTRTVTFKAKWKGVHQYDPRKSLTHG